MIPSSSRDCARRSGHGCYTKPVLKPPVESGQFTSWAFTNKIRSSGVTPSFGSIGNGLDNAMKESFG